MVPESADGCVEAIRALTVARRSAIKARTVAPNQINAVAVTAPEGLQDQLRGLTTPELVNACARLRPGTNSEPVTSATKKALRTPARRHQALTAEIADLDSELRRLCEQANPALLGAFGVGVEVASSLLIAAGDNPERMRSEASFAALCATSPIEASSGKTKRHRLNRGGNRQANNALWRIAMIRLRVDQKSIDYAARRTAEGKTRREILRCLKRHIAREIYKLLTDPPEVPRGADLRQQRTQTGLTIQAVAAALNTAPTRISELEAAKRTPPQPRPRPTLPTAPRPNPDLTHIGASKARRWPSTPGSPLIPVSRSTSADPRAHGSAARTRTPTVCCASTCPTEPTSHRSPNTTSTRSPPSSTADLDGFSNG